MVGAPVGALRLIDPLVDLLDAMRINPGLRRPSAMLANKAYSSAKARQALGWLPRYSLEEPLRDTLSGMAH